MKIADESIALRPVDETDEDFLIELYKSSRGDDFRTFEEPLALPEALLRGRRMDELFSGEIGDRDREVGRQICDALREIVREHTHANWYLPLGVGGHIDHRIAKDSASRVLKECGVRSVWFYEEMFYAAETGPKRSGGQLRPVNVKWKFELCRVYWSQFSAGRLNILEEWAYAVGEGKAVERVWPVAGDTPA